MSDVLKDNSNIRMDDDDLDGAEEETPPPVTHLQPKRSKNRRRRRSSARFLKLDLNGDDEDDEVPTMSSAKLGEVYQNAIRMNAENKINAANSWNLNLIDHLDRFVSNSSNTTTNTTSTMTRATPNETQESDGINFTKASCTLDASVKIYSYRVDDVHLTSYKVLANLNRTETREKGNKENNSNSTTSTSAASATRAERRKPTEVETIEQNLANINMTKLDEAFDIDPLFHKMSMAFDEGGAKGLLLANLGVSLQGCNIVFDSTLEEHGSEEGKDSSVDDKPTMTDVASLVQKLESTSAGQPIHLLPLVPQLAPLRDEYAQLHQEGFVEKNAPPTKRYAAPQEEEIEADRSIHLEAIERSRASQADVGRSLMAQEDSSSTIDDVSGPVDFGAGNDFGDDDDNDYVGSSESIHDGDHRFSSSSFQSTFEASQPPSQATVLLDAIANGDISGSQSNYECFSQKALDKIQDIHNGSNAWAGASHWKKTASTNIKKTSTGKGKKKSTTRKKTKKKSAELINLWEPVKNLDDLLRKPPKGRKGQDPLQLSKAMINKYSKNSNLLPVDLGLTVDDLSSFFFLPNAKLSAAGEGVSDDQKQVGFSGVDTSFGGNDVSYGDDEGPGFDFGGGNGSDSDSIIPELEGVRKVQKVQVGYATVAKKVDVKRLKHDLWEELERTFEERKKKQQQPIEQEEAQTSDVSIEEAVEPAPLSFQDTVKEMQSSQTQSDVTLPFYFICVLHLANEKGLALESTGLEDFIIRAS
eukprot:scaffold1228_cov119-Cylindrotheca_fusiformis.AAC.16